MMSNETFNITTRSETYDPPLEKKDDYTPSDKSIVLTLLVPILSLFLGSILHILTYVLLLFSLFCTMHFPLQDSGMTKLGFMSILFIIIILWLKWLKLA